MPRTRTTVPITRRIKDVEHAAEEAIARGPGDDAPRASELFLDRYREARLAGIRLLQDLEAAAAYIDRNGPTPAVAPRLMACMLSASSVMGALMRAGITLLAQSEE